MTELSPEMRCHLDNIKATQAAENELDAKRRDEASRISASLLRDAASDEGSGSKELIRRLVGGGI